MKKAGKYIIWIAGIIVWLFTLTMFWVIDTPTGNNTHQIILIITGVCLAIYIFRKTGSGAKELEKENQKLRAENEKLQAELDQQLVQRVMDKVENRGEGR